MVTVTDNRVVEKLAEQEVAHSFIFIQTENS